MASSPETAPSQTNSSTDSSSSNHDTNNYSPPSSTSSPATTSADSIKASNNSSSSTPATPPKSSPSSSGGSPPTPSPPPPAASSPPPPQSSSSTSSDSPSPPPPSSQSPPTQTSPPPPTSTSPPADASSAPPPPPTSTSKSPTPPSPPPPYSPNSPPAQSGSPTAPSYSPPPDDSAGAYEPPPSPTQTPTPPSSSPPSRASGGSSSPPGPVYSPRPPNSSAPQTFAPPGISPNPPGSGGGSPEPLDHRPPGPTPQSTSHVSNNTNVAVISGVVGGGVVVLALLVVLIVLVKKKKKPGFYPPKGGEQYYNGPEQWNTPQPVQLPPPPGFMGGTPVGMWGPVPPGGPPPPHQANTSSEFSSGYSGQPMTPIQQPPASPNIGAMAQFSHEELATATGGFSQANLLGQGGFGLVHKGILHDNREVAVKSLKTGSGQGEREFQAEVEIISRVHHRHLVSLVGYCIANGQRMLVYEYVPNKTLEFHLHGKGQPVMDWPTRVRIAVGSAKGLAYLHEDCHPRIIHRDIKAANILLDYNFEAMVADFGLAKLTSDNYTHVSTRVMGTFGYLAPEYASSGKLSEKSDVFSFGVMLLELITGRRPIDLTNTQMEDSLVDWARPLLTKAQESGNYDELVDPRLEGNYDHQEIAHMANCAAASIRHSARRRPKMSQIVRALEGDSSLDDLNEGVKPGQSNIYNPNGNAEAYDTNAYNADIDKFRKMVLDTKDFNSSTDYGTTSEYGLNPSASSSEEMSKHKP